jgi:hypothetical protein
MRFLIFLRQALIRLQNNLRVPEIHRQQFWLRVALRVFVPFFFPIIQRGHGDFGVFRVSMMHRFGIVTQRLLCEPLWIPALQSPFRPCIPIRMQRHARYSQPVTALTKFRGPVICPHGAKIHNFYCYSDGGLRVVNVQCATSINQFYETRFAVEYLFTPYQTYMNPTLADRLV